MNNDFQKFACAQGLGSARLDQYSKKIPTCGYVSPSIIEERQLNVAQMDVFSRLQMDRIIFLGTEIDTDVANIINAQLLYLNSIGDDDVKMFINTPGGSISAGLSIVDVMKFIKPDVNTYCMGYAASMGSIILSSGTKGKRYSLPHGEVLIHQPLGGTGYAQATDIDLYNKHIQYYKNETARILAENTGKTIEEILKDADRDNWFTAEKALNYGLIDKIIEKTN